VPYTKGFSTPKDRADHLQKHRGEFGAITEVEYETMADEFLGGPRSRDTLECLRSDGALLRYNPVTGEFAILARDSTITTYFKPYWRPREPARAAQYFSAQCQQ